MPVFDLGNFGEESDTDDDGESDSREGVSQPAAPVERVRDCTPVLIECEPRDTRSKLRLEPSLSR